MSKSLSTFKKTGLILAIFLVSMLSNQAQSQNVHQPSRVAVTVSDSKTNIWISDFPKKTTVMLVDNENNLLCIISTNDYGAAYTSLNKSVVSTIIARTLNGEINVSNKALIKSEKQQDVMVVTEIKTTGKV